VPGAKDLQSWVEEKKMQLPNALKLFGCSAPTRPRYSWLAVAMACVLKQVPYSSAQQNNPSTYPINKKKGGTNQRGSLILVGTVPCSLCFIYLLQVRLQTKNNYTSSKNTTYKRD
jgi:hypothetical protein